jgi:hypothetical protein
MSKSDVKQRTGNDVDENGKDLGYGWAHRMWCDCMIPCPKCQVTDAKT